MLNRALVLATVTLLIGCFAAAPVHAQNLEAGKSPSQIFAGTCTVCHKSPRGLLKTVSAGALPSFLRQHYTTSPEMAGLLSSYLVSNGAADKRYQGKDAKSDGRPEGQPGGAPQLDRQGRPVHTSAPAREPAKPQAEQQPAAKPDTAGISPQDDGTRKGRKRLARPAEEGATPAGDETAVRQAGEHSPDGRRLGAKERLSKRGKPGEEMPKGDAKGDAAKTDSGNEAPAASTATREEKPAGEATKDEGAKSSDKPSDETAKMESPKETAPKAPAGQTPALRADPVPAVTPAPAASPAAAAASGGSSEPAAGSSAPSAKPAAPAAASVPAPAQSAASEPASAAAPAPSSAPAGPPQPPISR
jgi:hypothetical protein